MTWMQDEVAEIIEDGLREPVLREVQQYAELRTVLDQLASLQTGEDVLALRPSPRLDERLQHLLAKSKLEGLTPEEAREWAAYEKVEHLVRIAKARVSVLLKRRA